MSDSESKTCATCKRVYVSEQDYLSGTSRWRVCSLGHLWFNCDCGSTLLIKKGKFEWYSPDKVMSNHAASVFNRLTNLRDLPHIPNSLMQLQQMISDPNVDPSKLAPEIKKDPVIAATLLQTAENLRKSRNPDNDPIESIAHAIVFIGMESLSDIIQSAALRVFELPRSEFDADSFWKESNLTGLVAERIAKHVGFSGDLDRIFLAGSLCNLGKIVIAICFPSLATKISRDVKDIKTLASWRAAERQYKFPEHTILGEIGAAIWGFPDFVIEAARKHHVRPEPEPDTTSPSEAEIITFANQVTHWILLQPSRIEQSLLDATRERFSMTERDLESFVEGVMPLQSAVNS